MVPVVVVLVSPLPPLRRCGHVRGSLVVDILKQGRISFTSIKVKSLGSHRNKTCNEGSNYLLSTIQTRLNWRIQPGLYNAVQCITLLLGPTGPRILLRRAHFSDLNTATPIQTELINSVSDLASRVLLTHNENNIIRVISYRRRELWFFC